MQESNVSAFPEKEMFTSCTELWVWTKEYILKAEPLDKEDLWI